jgi:adenylate cyclase
MADVVGYSRLMAEDEAATVGTLTTYRHAISDLVNDHRGRVVDVAGDSLLAEFRTARDAVECAVEVQRVLKARNTGLSEDRRMEFRIGVHLGDVMAEGDRIYGDGVNIAARLQALADPGSVCISAEVHGQVRHKLDLRYADLGEQAVKNIPDLVRVFRVKLEAEITHAHEETSSPPSGGVWRLVGRVALVLAGSAALVALVLWLSWPRPLGWALDLAGILAPPENPALPERPSLVVLPFLNLSDDPEQEYLADGITEEVTSDLAGIQLVFVISRSSAFTYKGATVNVAEVSRELGVRYVVEGSVRKVGERVRVTVQLIDALRDVHVWSERYDLGLGDLLDLQSEISEQILAALGVEIIEAELSRLRRKPTRSLSAYEAFIRGIGHVGKFTREGYAEARSHFERAIEVDPEFAAAHALLAIVHVSDVAVRCPSEVKPSPRARELALRAVALDPFDPMAQFAVWNFAYLEERTSEALAAAERAVELAPSLGFAHFARGMALVQSGRPREAVGAFRRALRLTPRPAPTFLGGLGWANYLVGRPDRAVEFFERARAMSPDLLPARLMLVGLYGGSGRHEKARVVAAEVLRGNPDCTADTALQLIPGLIGPEATRDLRENLIRAGFPAG